MSTEDLIKVIGLVITIAATFFGALWAVIGLYFKRAEKFEKLKKSFDDSKIGNLTKAIDEITLKIEKEVDWIRKEITDICVKVASIETMTKVMTKRYDKLDLRVLGLIERIEMIKQGIHNEVRDAVKTEIIELGERMLVRSKKNG